MPHGSHIVVAKKTTKRPKRRRPPSDEQRVDLMLWPKDGQSWLHAGSGRALPTVGVGRTDSERGLGFEMTMHPHAESLAAAERTWFVLDRRQVEKLHTFLAVQLTRIVDD